MSEIEIRLQVRELIECFHDAVNHRELEALGTLFTEDGIWEIASPVSMRFQGRKNIVAGMMGAMQNLDFMVQSCSPIVVGLRDSTTATARTSVQELGRLKDGRSIRIVGTYFDEVRNEAGVWRFAQRVFRTRYTEEPVLAGASLERPDR